MKKIINNIPFPFEIEKKLSKLLVIPGNYNKLKNEDLEKVKKTLLKQKKNYNIIPSNAIIRSIRSAYVNQREIINYKDFDKYKKKIIKEYFKHNDIFKISKDYDFSPIRILKYLLQYHKVNKKNINNILTLAKDKKINKIKKNYSFNSKFIYNIQEVIKNDIFNTIDQELIKEYASAFERKVEYCLKKKYKLKFKTEETLMREQTEKYGRPIITPDFLLMEDFYINNKKINWIDAKNYYGANTTLIKKTIKKQMEKYNNQFGSGAIIFNLGYSSALNNFIDNNKIILISFNDFDNI